LNQGVLHLEGFLLVALNPSKNHNAEQGIAELLYLRGHVLLQTRGSHATT
jgi:hypothetical protein